MVMLRPDRSIERVYLYRSPIDMRKQMMLRNPWRGMDGLSLLVKHAMQLDPLSGALFVFINRSRNKLKLLLWERNGFIVWYKRLEQDRFAWPRHMDQSVLTLSGEQLNWLLDGYDDAAESLTRDVWRMKRHRSLEYSIVS